MERGSQQHGIGFCLVNLQVYLNLSRSPCTNAYNVTIRTIGVFA